MQPVIVSKEADQNRKDEKAWEHVLYDNGHCNKPHHAVPYHHYYRFHDSWDNSFK